MPIEGSDGEGSLIIEARTRRAFSTLRIRGSAGMARNARVAAADAGKTATSHPRRCRFTFGGVRGTVAQLAGMEADSRTPLRRVASTRPLRAPGLTQAAWAALTMAMMALASAGWASDSR